MLLTKTIVKKSGRIGLGLFAAEPIAKDQKVWLYDSIFCTNYPFDEVSKMSALQQTFIKKFAVPSDSFWHLDIDDARFINHSECPTIQFDKSWEIGVTSAKALRSISAGEEITCDYKTFNPMGACLLKFNHGDPKIHDLLFVVDGQDIGTWAKEAKIVRSMLKYIETFIEAPNEAFGGMPVCPFAATARLQDKVKFIVWPLRLEDAQFDSELSQTIERLFQEGEYEEVMFISPTKDGISLADLHDLTEVLRGRHAKTFAVFAAHPKDTKPIAGVEIRDPYPNLILTRADILKEARIKLLGTNYYAKWTQEEMKDNGLIP